MSFQAQDYYFKKAKKERFAARSIFKLEEVDRRLQILRPGDQVLDLGSFPGSWSQYISKKIGLNGKLLGIDLKKTTYQFKNATFLEKDLYSFNLKEWMVHHHWDKLFNVIVSDMAPQTTGVKITDQARSHDLCELALQISKSFLLPRGHFVCKIFQGPDFHEFRKKLRQEFNQVEIVRPKSTRKSSTEVFLVGKEKKQDVHLFESCHEH